MAERSYPCPYQPNGCAWRGPPDHLEQHTRECQYQNALVGCHMCGAQMQAENLDEHLSAHCPKRLYCCDYCGKYEGEYEEVKQKHYPRCEGFPVPCCNPNCTLGSITRADYAVHAKSEYRDLQRRLQDEVKRLEKERDQARSEYRDLQRRLQGEVKRLEKEKGKLKEKLEQEKEALKSKLAEIDVLKEWDKEKDLELKKSKDEITSLKSELKKQTEELKAVQKKVKDLEGEKVELQKQVQQEKKFAESSIAEPGDQEVQEKERDVELKKREDEIAALKLSEKKKDEEIKKSKDEISALKLSEKEKDVGLKKSKEEITALKMEIGKLKQQWDSQQQPLAHPELVTIHEQKNSIPQPNPQPSVMPGLPQPEELNQSRAKPGSRDQQVNFPDNVRANRPSPPPNPSRASPPQPLPSQQNAATIPPSESNQPRPIRAVQPSTLNPQTSLPVLQSRPQAGERNISQSIPLLVPLHAPQPTQPGQLASQPASRSLAQPQMASQSVHLVLKSEPQPVHPTVLQPPPQRFAQPVPQPVAQPPPPLPPQASINWESCKRMLTKMYGGNAVLVGNCVYYGGGSSSQSEREPIVNKYDPTNATWTCLPSVQRKKFTLVNYQQKLVAIGGITHNDSYSRNLSVWDDKAEQWKEISPRMKATRVQCTAISYNERIIVAGGKNVDILKNIEVYDGQRWQNSPKRLPLPMHSASSTIINGRWYLAGGETNQGPDKTVHCIPIDAIISPRVQAEWGTLMPLEYKRSTLVTFRNTLLAVGGIDVLNSEIVYMYSTNESKWVELRKVLPTSCHWVAAVQLNDDALMVIGGCGRLSTYDHAFLGTLITD